MKDNKKSIIVCENSTEDEIDLGILINHIREDKKISLEKLCKGICTKGYLFESIKGLKNPNHSIISLLLQRLGLDEYEYEDYISNLEYKKYINKKDIFNLLENEDADKAMEKLNLFEKTEDMSNKFNKRFLLIANAGIMYLKKHKSIDIADIIKEAIQITAPQFLHTDLSNIILGTDELFLILEYARLKPNNHDKISSHDIYEDVIKYINKWDSTELVKAKLYPKAICLANKKHLKDKQYKKVLHNCNTALKHLQDCGKLYFIIEVLEDKIKSLKGILKIITSENYLCYCNLEKTEELKSECNKTIAQKKVLCEIFKKYNTKNSCLNWYVFQHTMEIYPIGEIIKIRRNMFSITQEKLSEGVCSDITVLRLENNTSTHPVSAKKLLHKLNLSGSLNNSCILSSDYEAHKLRDKIDTLIVLQQYVEAYELLKSLKKKINLSININKQYFEYVKTLCSLRTEKISKKRSLVLYKNALEITIPESVVFDEGKQYFSKRELIIMSNIASTYEKIKDYENAEKWYKMLENYYESFNKRIDNSIITYELVMSKYESFLGNIKKYEKSNEIIEKTLPISLNCKRGWFLVDYLYALIWNKTEQIKDERELSIMEKEFYVNELQKTRIVAGIMNDRVLEKFIENKIKTYS